MVIPICPSVIFSGEDDKKTRVPPVWVTGAYLEYRVGCHICLSMVVLVPFVLVPIEKAVDLSPIFLPRLRNKNASLFRGWRVALNVETEITALVSCSREVYIYIEVFVAVIPIGRGAAWSSPFAAIPGDQIRRLVFLDRDLLSRFSLVVILSRKSDVTWTDEYRHIRMTNAGT